MVGKFFSAVIAVCTLLTVVFIGYYLGWVRIPVFEKQLSELESDCVVAAIHADARWAGDVDEAVRREVGRAVIRHARVFRRDICDVFRLGLTLVPDGYERWGGVYFRTEKYVRNSLEATEASWKSDFQLVQELFKEGADGCATHYLRKHRRSDWAAQSETARADIRSTMRSVGRAKNEDGEEVGHAEFFCPRD